MVVDDITTGPSSDLQQLTKLARGMVTKWGMSEKMGPIALETEDGEPIYGSVLINKKHSEKVAADIDVEVKSIIDKAYKTAENILIEQIKALNSIAEKLVDVETLEREEFEKLLILNGIKPKEDEEKETSDK